MHETSQGTTAKVEVLRLYGVTFDVSIIQDLEHLRILELGNVDIIGLLEKFSQASSSRMDFWGCSMDGGMLEAMGTLVSLRCLKIENYGLTSFPQSFGRMKALESLELCGFDNLIGLLDTFCQLQALTELRVTYCSGFKALPEAIGQLRALRYLIIKGCGLETLPESFGQLGALRRLELRRCSKLRSLPRSFGNLCALEYLCVKKCPCADKFSIISAGELQVLRHLHIQYKKCAPVTAALFLLQFPTLECLLIEDEERKKGKKGEEDDYSMLGDPVSVNLESDGVETCNAKFHNAESDGTESDLANFDELPPGGDGLDIGNDSGLRNLRIGCHEWVTRPGSLRQHQGLERLHVSGRRLEALPEYLGQLQALKVLNITDCDFQRLPESLGQLGALQRLHIFDCKTLEALPSSVGRLSALEELLMGNCYSFKTLPESLWELKALKYLRPFGCWKLEALPESVGYLSSLESLLLLNCSSIRVLPSSLSQLAPKCKIRDDRYMRPTSIKFAEFRDLFNCRCED